METLGFELPYPPSLNHYYRRANKGVLISSEGRAYRARVQGALLQQRVQHRGIPLPFCGRVGMSILVFPPDRRRRDLDNIPKAVLDCLTHNRVWQDDSQLDYLEIERKESKMPGMLMIKVWAM